MRRLDYHDTLFSTKYRIELQVCCSCYGVTSQHLLTLVIIEILLRHVDGSQGVAVKAVHDML